MANTNSQGNQAISPNRKARTASRGGRAPKHQAKATSLKPKHQASSQRSVKHQALYVGPVVKRQAWRFTNIGE